MKKISKITLEKLLYLMDLSGSLLVKSIYWKRSCKVMFQDMLEMF